MRVFITDDCINCSACAVECPVKAIFPKAGNEKNENKLFINNNFLVNGFISYEHYYVNPRLCNECKGHYFQPRCNQVCPVSCCISDNEIEMDNYGAKVKTNPILFSKISLN